MDPQGTVNRRPALVRANRINVFPAIESSEESEVELLETECEKVFRELGVPRKGQFKLQPRVGGRVVYSKRAGLPVYGRPLTNYMLLVNIIFRACLVIAYMLLEWIPSRRSLLSISPNEFKYIREPLRTPMFLELGGDLVGPVLERLFHPWAFMLYPFFAILWKYWKTQKVFDYMRSWMVPTLIYPLTGCLVGILKIVVGRPRPSMFARCYGEDYLDYKDFSYACTGNETLIFDGMKSFPSGHTSVAFASSTFLFLYLAGHFRIWVVVEQRSAAFLRLWPAKPKASGFLLAILTITPALLVGVSRVVANNHHIEDVMFGAMIGTTVAVGVYFIYFPSLISPWCSAPKGAGDDDLFELEDLDANAQVKFIKKPDPSLLQRVGLTEREEEFRAGNRNTTFLDSK
ncbi:unnamed protein product [Orchesella dallaii]|uniref:Phosphatidic acid phosphatase type 2/haloperoxidase domain-containing protein n=1 Tax=Orchesella dallaii TaxID=48710 RepID=A0ABP1QY69_9HEXA